MDLSLCVLGQRQARVIVPKNVLLLIVLMSSWTWHRADFGVSCVVLESCTLPCAFPPGDEVIIHWVHLAENALVHSYYYNKDQLSLQDQRFRGRTSLFHSQIPRGNASLLLRGVEVKDQGRYKCYTSTVAGRQHSIMALKVEVPVRKVNIQKEGDMITCSSEGIYPKPELTWANGTLRSTSSVQQTVQELYSISSSLLVADQNYSCTVSTHTSRRRATWFQPTSVSGSNSETTINCMPTKTPLTGLVWRFNHSHVILNRTGTAGSDLVSEGWRQKVKHVSESGSLTLLPPPQEGMYTCEVSDAEETYFTNILLRAQEDSGVLRIIGITVGVVGIQAFVLVVVVVVCLWKKKRIHGEKTEKSGEEQEEAHHLNSGVKPGKDDQC